MYVISRQKFQVPSKFAVEQQYLYTLQDLNILKKWVVLFLKRCSHITATVCAYKLNDARQRGRCITISWEMPRFLRCRQHWQHPRQTSPGRPKSPPQTIRYSSRPSYIKKKIKIININKLILKSDVRTASLFLFVNAAILVCSQTNLGRYSARLDIWTDATEIIVRPQR